MNNLYWKDSKQKKPPLGALIIVRIKGGDDVFIGKVIRPGITDNNISGTCRTFIERDHDEDLKREKRIRRNFEWDSHLWILFEDFLNIPVQEDFLNIPVQDVVLKRRAEKVKDRFSLMDVK